MKINKKLILGFLVIFVPIVFGCLASIQLIIHKCIWWNCAPDRDFSIYQLDIPDEFFPPGAQTHPLTRDRKGPSVEAASTTNYWNGGKAIYLVRRFATEAQSTRAYLDTLEYNIFNYPKTDEYKEILEFHSANADDQFITCMMVQKDHRCIYVARYKEYDLFFSGSMSITEMSEESFLGVIHHIDKLFEKYLN